MKLRRSVPQVVRDLRTDERRIAWGVTVDGLPLVATPTTLYAGTERLTWVSVEKVVWRPSTLTLHEVAEVEGTGRVRAWELAEDGRLAETVRERVTASVGWSDRRTLAPGAQVRLVGRRVPGQDLLEWQVIWAPGTDPRDPVLQAQVRRELDGLRRSIG